MPQETPPCKPEPLSPIVALRVRLNDLRTPPEIVGEVERWCKKYGPLGEKGRREVEEQFKLEYYYGGEPIYLIHTSEGLVVVPIAEPYKSIPDLRYALLTADERQSACLTVPSLWRDVASFLN